MVKKLIPTAITFCLLSAAIPAHSLAEEPETSPANQPETVQAKPPQWSELCSNPYCHLSRIEIPEAKPYPSDGSAVLAAFVPVLMPAWYAKKREAIKSQWDIRRALNRNYWVQRREDFDREVVQCQQMKDNDKLVDCYMNVRQIENNKNQAHRQELLMMEQRDALYGLQFHIH
jgi:hypothetical protein